MKSVGIVVVTYNRLNCLKHNIECILNMTIDNDISTKIYVIDNASTDGTYEYVKSIEKTNKDIIYLRLKENTGGSGGFYSGIKKAYEDENDFVFGMDDDAYVKQNCLKVLFDTYNRYKDVCLFANSNNDNEGYSDGVKITKNWMFVGFMLPRVVIEKVGFPRGDFFIYHDDLDYYDRIIENKFIILKVKDAIVEHRNGAPAMLPEKKIGPFTIRFYDLPDWKLYYYIRNRMLKYDKRPMRKIREMLKGFVDCIKITILNSKQKSIAFKGLKDGILGVSGRVITP